METCLFVILQNMLKIIIYFLIILLYGTSCSNKKAIEDPFNVAKSYCNCVDEELKNSKDSLINIYDCEKKTFPNSRLMRIYLAYDEYNNYVESTIDSAKSFSLKVRDIIDTMCFNKIDPKRKKKIPHIKM